MKKTVKQQLKDNALKLSKLSNDHGKYINIDTAEYIIKQAHLLNLMSWRDMKKDNTEKLYNQKDSERRAKRLEKRYKKLNEKINPLGFRFEFYGAWGCLEIQSQKGNWLETYCTIQ